MRTPFHRSSLVAACSLALLASQSFAANGLDPNNLDRKVRPGDDFYHYANGGWIAKNPIPADYSRWGAFEELSERNNAILRAILDEAAATAATAPQGSSKQKIGDFYASGMDEAAIEAAGIEPLRAEFNAIDAIHSRAQIVPVLARMHRLGIESLFNSGVGQDEKDSKTQIVQVHQGGLGLPDRDYYFKDDERSRDLREKYIAHVDAMFVLLGQSKEAAAASAAAVMRFETALAEYSKSRVELRDPEANYHKMPLANLVSSAPGLDWNAYFVALGAPEPGGMNINQPAFCTRVAAMASEDGLPLEDWKTYLRWRLIHSVAPCLGKAFEEESFAFYGKVLTGAKEMKPRWKRVLQETNGSLGELLGQLYVEKAFSPEAKKRCLAMVEDLREVLSQRIQKLDWMGADTKVAAQKKLAAFGVKIGYPDKWRDYSALEISRRAYVLNVLAANEFETNRELAKRGKPVDRGEWHMTPPTVNAYYSPTMNEIVFPAGILQPPFFDESADDAVNYGGIGGVIGHEMTHGFDDQGRQYDAEGNLKNWWTDDDLKRFKERSAAIVKQFDDIVAIDDMRINGQLTQGENIADLGGIKLAYAALERALARQPEDKRELPIDGFSPRQRLFLSWAQVWRNNIRPEALRLRINTDPHSPGRWRANAPLTNLPEFQSAFGLPAASPMQRAANERVEIW